MYEFIEIITICSLEIVIKTCKYRNLPMQYTEIFFRIKNLNFMEIFFLAHLRRRLTHSPSVHSCCPSLLSTIFKKSSLKPPGFT